MIDLRKVFDVRDPSFLISAVATAIVIVFIVPWIFPGDAYRYDISAHWTEDKSGTLLVTGDLQIRRPCPGSTVTTVYEFPDKLDPQPAVRTGHIEAEIVGKSTVVMGVTRADTIPVASTFQPPPGAVGIRWLLAPSRAACPDEAKRNPFEVGYVQIPPRRP